MRKLRSMTFQDSSTHDSVSNDCSTSHNVTQNAEHIVDTLPEFETSAMSDKELCNPPRMAPNKRLKNLLRKKMLLLSRVSINMEL